MSDYLHSLTIVAPAADAAPVRALFAAFETVAEGELPLALALTGDGQAVTHYAGHTVITETTRLMLLGAMAVGATPHGVQWQIVPNDPASERCASNVPGYEPAAEAEPRDLFAVLGLTIYDVGAI